MRAGRAAAMAVAIGVVVLLGACGSSSSSSSSGSTTTTAAPGRPTIDAFQVPSAATCTPTAGHVEVEWKTTNANEVALFVDGVQAASGPYADGNDALAVTCNGAPHTIRIDAMKGDAKTSRTQSVTTTNSGGATPTLCENSQGVGEGAVGAYGGHIGNPNPQATVFSVRCAPATGAIPGQYAIVTLATQTASGRFRVLMLQPPPSANQGVSPIGFDTEEGAPPGFTYTDCGLDPAALAALGLPPLAPSGDSATRNCPVPG